MPKKAGKFIVFHMPKDPAYLQAIGGIAIRHAQLDHVLRFTIKTLTNVTPQEATLALQFVNSSELRERIKKIARKELGEGPALVRLQALLRRCKDATDKRNEVMHSICGLDLNSGKAHFVGAKGTGPLPKVKGLNALEDEIWKCAEDLNAARLTGFLFEALAHRRKAPQ